MSRERWIAWGSAALLLSMAAVLLYARGGATDREEVLWRLALLVTGVLIGLASRLSWLDERARRAAHAELAAARQEHDAQSAELRQARQRLAEEREAVQRDARQARQRLAQEREAMQQKARQVQKSQVLAWQQVTDWKAKATDAERRRRNATGAAERRRRRLERISERS